MISLSIVTTMYNSSTVLREFYARISAEARKAAENHEIIFVNDGSPDDSLDVAKELLRSDPCVRIVDLAANFGHHKAMMAGLERARGEMVLLIDCDLEEPPEILSRFLEVYSADPLCDMVFGVQKTRKGGTAERVSGALFYSILNRLSGINIPPNVTTARLMSRRYVRSIIGFRERELYLAGIMHIAGFRQIPVEVEKQSRHASSYNASRKTALLINAVTSFSNKPLVYIFYTGLFISLMSVIYSAYLVISKLFFEKRVPGWTSTMLSVWLFGGLIILFMGIVGLYISRAFIEIKHRPYVIVRAEYDSGNVSAPPESLRGKDPA